MYHFPTCQLNSCWRAAGAGGPPPDADAGPRTKGPPPRRPR
jgi:hypothetical protein